VYELPETNHCLTHHQALLSLSFFVGDVVSKPKIMQLVKSVFSAAIGIQSDENRRKEFEQAAPLSTYVIAGVIFTILFVGSLILLVSIIL
jgi:hypothetical protein